MTRSSDRFLIRSGLCALVDIWGFGIRTLQSQWGFLRHRRDFPVHLLSRVWGLCSVYLFIFITGRISCQFEMNSDCVFMWHFHVRNRLQDLLSFLVLKCCVFVCHCQAYKWTGDNLFFIKGDMDSLAFGGGRSVTRALIITVNILNADFHYRYLCQKQMIMQT